MRLIVLAPVVTVRHRGRKIYHWHRLAIFRLGHNLGLHLLGRRLSPAVLPNEVLQLGYPGVHVFNAELGLHGDAVISVKLLLQLNNGLISFVEARREGNHDVSLLQQQVLVPVHLGLPLFDLVPLSLDLVEFDLVFLSDEALLLL